MGETSKFLRYQVSMMVCKNLVVGKAVWILSETGLPGISQLTEMGRHAGSWRRVVIGLDLRLGPDRNNMCLGLRGGLRPSTSSIYCMTDTKFTEYKSRTV
jgi:hypothetical protein